MTEEQAREKTLNVLANAVNTMKQKLEKAFLTGAFNLEGYEDDYVLPKIIAHALLKDAADDFKPVNKNDIKTSNNLYIQL